MPTVLRIEGFRFYFYSHEPNEPPHVHIDRGSSSAKLWLHDGSIARNFGYNGRELAELVKLVREHQTALMEAWRGYFGGGR